MRDNMQTNSGWVTLMQDLIYIVVVEFCIPFSPNLRDLGVHGEL